MVGKYENKIAAQKVVDEHMAEVNLEENLSDLSNYFCLLPRLFQSKSRNDKSPASIPTAFTKTFFEQ